MNPAKRLIYLSIGFIALGLGIAGAFLPLLPTTGFVLLAAWAFARSSERFHRMLLEHRRFGPLIHQWQTHRCLSRRTKIVAGASILASFALSIFLFRHSPLVVSVLLAVMVTLMIYIGTRREALGARNQR